MFGRFTTQTKEGSGNAVIQLPDEAAGFAMTAVYNGKKFTVDAQDAPKQKIVTMVNSTGDYGGITFYSSGTRPAKSIKVTAEGAWKITINSAVDTAKVAQKASGRMDGVLRYDGEASRWTIKREAGSNMTVKQITRDGAAIVGTANGAGTTNLSLKAGPSLLVISSDAPWTLEKQG